MSKPRWKVAGALYRPNGRRVHWYVPQWQVNAVFGLSSSDREICQYPALQFNVEKNCASPEESRQSSIRGTVY